MATHKDSVFGKLLSSIYGHGEGWVFTPSYFRQVGSRVAVASALKRLKASGVIRQIAHGLYDYPVRHPDYGLVPPSSDAVAKAIAGQSGAKLQPSGAYAANMLGITEQVPVRAVFLTVGLARRVKLGKREVILRRTTPRNMLTAGSVSGNVIQALRWIGEENVDQEVIVRLKRRLSEDDRSALLRDARYAPLWIGKIMRAIANDPQ